MQQLQPSGIALWLPTKGLFISVDPRRDCGLWWLLSVWQGEYPLSCFSPWSPWRFPLATKPHGVATEQKSSWCSNTGGSGHPTHLLKSCATKREGHVLGKAAPKRVFLVYGVGLNAWGSPESPAGSGLSLPALSLAYKWALLLVQMFALVMLLLPKWYSYFNLKQFSPNWGEVNDSAITPNNRRELSKIRMCEFTQQHQNLLLTSQIHSFLMVAYLEMFSL